MKPVLFACIALLCLASVVFSAPTGVITLAAPVVTIAAADAAALGLLGGLAVKKAILLGAAAGAAAGRG